MEVEKENNGATLRVNNKHANIAPLRERKALGNLNIGTPVTRKLSFNGKSPAGRNAPIMDKTNIPNSAMKNIQNCRSPQIKEENLQDIKKAAKSEVETVPEENWPEIEYADICIGAENGCKGCCPDGLQSICTLIDPFDDKDAMQWLKNFPSKPNVEFGNDIIIDELFSSWDCSLLHDSPPPLFDSPEEKSLPELPE